MKTRNALRILQVIEYLTILITLGLLTYFAENQQWGYFVITLVVFAALEGIIKLKSFSPVEKYFKEKEKEEFKLSSAFKEYGMSDIYLMDRKDGPYGIDERNNKIQKAINGGTEFNLLAETGKSYIDDSIRKHWDNLKPKIDKGFKFRILIINPFSEVKRIRNKLNNIKGNLDPKLNLQRLNYLNEKYDGITVRFTNELYCSIFYTDNYLIFDPYHLGKLGNRLENYFFAIDFESNSYGYAMLKNHFETSWENSMSFDEFKKEFDPNGDIIPS